MTFFKKWKHLENGQVESTLILTRPKKKKERQKETVENEQFKTIYNIMAIISYCTTTTTTTTNNNL